MVQEATNTFSKGIIQDVNPIAQSNDSLVDAKNATFITFNGNEMSLQNDMGNTKLVYKDLSGLEQEVKLRDGFIPIGVKEHGDIIYIASYNPDLKQSEIGSFPSPEYHPLDIEDKSNKINSGLKENITLNNIETIIDDIMFPFDVISDYRFTLLNLNLVSNNFGQKLYKPIFINTYNNQDISDYININLYNNIYWVSLTNFHNCYIEVNTGNSTVEKYSIDILYGNDKNPFKIYDSSGNEIPNSNKLYGFCDKQYQFYRNECVFIASIYPFNIINVDSKKIISRIVQNNSNDLSNQFFNDDIEVRYINKPFFLPNVSKSKLGLKFLEESILSVNMYALDIDNEIKSRPVLLMDKGFYKFKIDGFIVKSKSFSYVDKIEIIIRSERHDGTEFSKQKYILLKNSISSLDTLDETITSFKFNADEDNKLEIIFNDNGVLLNKDFNVILDVKFIGNTDLSRFNFQETYDVSKNPNLWGYEEILDSENYSFSIKNIKYYNNNNIKNLQSLYVNDYSEYERLYAGEISDKNSKYYNYIGKGISGQSGSIEEGAQFMNNNFSVIESIHNRIHFDKFSNHQLSTFQYFFAYDFYLDFEIKQISKYLNNFFSCTCDLSIKEKYDKKIIHDALTGEVQQNVFITDNNVNNGKAQFFYKNNVNNILLHNKSPLSNEGADSYGRLLYKHNYFPNQYIKGLNNLQLHYKISGISSKEPLNIKGGKDKDGKPYVCEPCIYAHNSSTVSGRRYPIALCPTVKFNNNKINIDSNVINYNFNKSVASFDGELEPINEKGFIIKFKYNIDNIICPTYNLQELKLMSLVPVYDGKGLARGVFSSLEFNIIDKCKYLLLYYDELESSIYSLNEQIGINSCLNIVENIYLHRQIIDCSNINEQIITLNNTNNNIKYNPILYKLTEDDYNKIVLNDSFNEDVINDLQASSVEMIDQILLDNKDIYEELFISIDKDNIQKELFEIKYIPLPFYKFKVDKKNVYINVDDGIFEKKSNSPILPPDLHPIK